MAVTVIDGTFGENGFEASHAAFLETHEANSRDILNLAEGRKQKAPRPIFDPNHPDNRWPLMIHHPVNGELEVGRSLKGVSDPKARAAIEKSNQAELQGYLGSGWRLEPYPKPQVLVQDAASEKAQMLRENAELRGQLASAHDIMAKLGGRLEAMEKYMHQQAGGPGLANQSE